MVRTLVFHTNNVGSIPAGLNINVTRYTHLSPLIFSSRKANRSIKYSFRFVSIIAPSFESSHRLSSNTSTNQQCSRVRIRRSYLLLTWLSYLTSSRQQLSLVRPKLAVLPSKRSVYTLPRAPMAHKTSSKEQFEFYFYNFKLSVDVPLDTLCTTSTVSSGAYVASLLKSSFPLFETNVLFLKSYVVRYWVSDVRTFRQLS